MAFLNLTSYRAEKPNRGKIFGWISTPVHGLVFVGILVSFHPLQVIARKIGYLSHKRVVDLLNGALLLSLKLVGTRIYISGNSIFPTDRALIIVSNHQSMYDIPLLGWIFRRNHPKYVSKIELSRGIPSVSYNLREGGSVVIDRSNPRQALPLIEKLGGFIEEKSYAACIFPEGTRAKDGKMKPFQSAGLLKLVRSAPSALVVPVAISGSWELMRYKFCPIPFGVKLSCTVTDPIEASSLDGRELVTKIEDRILTTLQGLG